MDTSSVYTYLYGFFVREPAAPPPPPDPIETLLWFLGMFVCGWLLLVFVKWILRWVDAVLGVISYGMYIATVAVCVSVSLYSVIYCLNKPSECILLMDNLVAYARPVLAKGVAIVRAFSRVFVELPA